MKRKRLPPGGATHPIGYRVGRHEAPGCAVPLQAIRLLRKRLGDEVALVGKVFGPWTLGYHVLGVEEFLISTLLEPDQVKWAMAVLKWAWL